MRTQEGVRAEAQPSPEAQTGRQTGRQTEARDRQTDRQGDRQADRQTDSRTNRRTDRQTDRETGRQGDRLVFPVATREDLSTSTLALRCVLYFAHTTPGLRTLSIRQIQERGGGRARARARESTAQVPSAEKAATAASLRKSCHPTTFQYCGPKHVPHIPPCRRPAPPRRTARHRPDPQSRTAAPAAPAAPCAPPYGRSNSVVAPQSWRRASYIALWRRACASPTLSMRALPARTPCGRHLNPSSEPAGGSLLPPPPPAARGAAAPSFRAGALSLRSHPAAEWTPF